MPSFFAFVHLSFYLFSFLASLLPRESPIQDNMSGDESSVKLYEASGAGRNTAQRLGEFGRGMGPCAKIGRPAHGSMSQREWIQL